jgi:peptide/nickel transport system substrate-binding protein
MSYIPIRHLFLASVAFGFIILLTLAGCTLDPAPAPTPTPSPPTPTPLPRGGNLTIRLAENVPDLRPWQPRSRGEEQIISLLYTGLTRLDTQLRPQPDIAQSWEPSADGRLITFTLRSDVSWHDGVPLTAEDVVFTLDSLRAISPTTPLLDHLGRITEMSVPASTTLVISMTEGYAPILSSLATPILPRHLLAGRNLNDVDFWEQPVGTGPFKFEERAEGESITLAFNPNFYRGPPLLDRVAFVVAPDAQVATQALGSGQLLLAELPWENGATLPPSVTGVRTGSYAENGYYYLGFNVREGRPFADVRVREALALAVDLPQLVNDVTQGRGMPIANSAAPGSWADLVKPPTNTADLDRARSLLDEAGWRAPEGGGARQRDGAPLAAQLFVRGDDERRVRAAERIAEAAQTIGISVTVQPADFDTVIRSKFLPPYDFDMLLGSWSNGAGDPTFPDYAYYDPDDFPLFHSSQINQGVADTRPVLNFTGFSDAAYDNQSISALQLYDIGQRSQWIQRAQERIADQKPYLFLWADHIPVAISERLTTLDGPIAIDTPMYLANVERWYLRP